jgi:hypothetical protein
MATFPAYPGGSSGGWITPGGGNPYSGSSRSTARQPPFIAQPPYSVGLTSSYGMGLNGYPFEVTRNPEFDQRPFMVGSLTGIRCFRVDNLGRLNPINDFPNSVWTPGENIATCHRQWQIEQYMQAYGPIGLSAQMVSSMTSLTVSAGDAITVETERAVRESFKIPEHDKAIAGCSCGFYAYYDNLDNPHHQQGFLYGIVEGYGVMTVGTRGFRCSKAKILALVIPVKHRPLLWVKASRNYNTIPQFETDADAFRQFPLSLPSDIPNPDNTDDFWTRNS